MCCPALPEPGPHDDSGGVLTLLVPESRPPLLDLTGPYEPDPDPPAGGGQPDLFEPALATAVVSRPGSVSAPLLAAAGQACTTALLDVLASRRRPQQLARWTTEQVLADLVMLARSVHRHPVRPVHPYVQVADRAAEIVVPFVPARGDWAPLRVLTARVEPYAGRWRCNHLGWVVAPHRPTTSEVRA